MVLLDKGATVSYGDTKIGYQKIPVTVQQNQVSERMTDS